MPVTVATTQLEKACKVSAKGEPGSTTDLFTQDFSQLSLGSQSVASWHGMTGKLASSNKKVFSFLHPPDNPKSMGWQLQYRSGLYWNVEMLFLPVITAASVFLNIMGVWLLLHRPHVFYSVLFEIVKHERIALGLILLWGY